MSCMNEPEGERHHEGALLESINHTVTRMAEAMADVPGRVARIEEDVTVLKDDVSAIKLAVTDLSREVRDHGGRLAKLEESEARHASEIRRLRQRAA